MREREAVVSPNGARWAFWGRSIWALAAIAALLVPGGAAGQVSAQARKAPPPAVQEDEQLSPRARDDWLVEKARHTLERNVRIQLDFVQRACAPTAEQAADLERAGEKIVAGLLDDMEQWVRATHQLPGSILPAAGAPIRAIDQQLEQALDAALDGERAAQLEGERRAVDEGLTQARLGNWVAAIDRKLLLSAQQREEFLRVLAARWRRSKQPPPSYTAFFNGDALLFHRVGIGHTAVSRTLPELPDADWTVILNASQRAVWAESHQPRQPENLAIRIQGQRVVVQAAAVAVTGTPRLASFLKLVLDDVDAAAGLSDSQRHKLELAGKLDIERYEERLAELRAKLADQQQQQQGGPGGVRFVPTPAQRKLLATPCATITDDESMFRKLLARVLSAQQARQLAEVERARREFADEAARQGVVALIAERVPLASAQWSEVSKLLDERCGPLGGVSFDGREIAAKVPGKLLKPLFGEAQWELLGPLFGPQREVAP